MSNNINNCIFKVNEDIIVRDFDGDLLIIPIKSGVGNMEDELYSFNETGRAIWEKINGENTISEIINALCLEYESVQSDVEEDVIGIVTELINRKLIYNIEP